MTILIGTAGWSIPRQVADAFPNEGSSLQRYAARFLAAEINSSFHRSHRLDTWARWRDSVPDEFRFCVKLPREITHTKKLVGCSGELGGFLEQAHTLGDKLAVLLVQLPPKLAFDDACAQDFFTDLHARSEAAIVCEPRHASWFTREVNDLLACLRVGRVAADPSLCEAAARPGGWLKIKYWRLHGSPFMYRSSYQDRLEFYAQQLKLGEEDADEVWCIFDNTASSAAGTDALALQHALGQAIPRSF